MLLDGVFGYTRLRLGAQNIDIDKNYGLDVLKIPGTNGTDPLQGGYPRFTFNTFSNLGNPNVSNPFLFRDNQYVTSGNLSWSKGSHSFRFGVRVQPNTTSTIFSRRPPTGRAAASTSPAA